MWSRAYRDRAEVPALQAPMAAFDEYLRQIRDDLATPWGVTGKDEVRLKVTLEHALRFATWQTLQRELRDEAEMVDLVSRWIACLGKA
jgi:hypothetical protein